MLILVVVEIKIELDMERDIDLDMDPDLNLGLEGENEAVAEAETARMAACPVYIDTVVLLSPTARSRGLVLASLPSCTSNRPLWPLCYSSGHLYNAGLCTVEGNTCTVASIGTTPHTDTAYCSCLYQTASEAL